MKDQMEIKGIPEKDTRVDTYKFDTPKPIKGYPELHWHGKRPYTSTQYYPAQLRETHGEPKDGWFNKIYWGDNLQVMSHLLKEYRGKINLIYIDPPFDSKADYKMKIVQTMASSSTITSPVKSRIRHTKANRTM